MIGPRELSELETLGDDRDDDLACEPIEVGPGDEYRTDWLDV